MTNQEIITALALAKEALDQSVPKQKNYPEPVQRHEAAIVALAAVIDTVTRQNAPKDEGDAISKLLRESNRAFRVKGVFGKFVRDNEVNIKHKKTYQLAYALYYGAYDGSVPGVVNVALMTNRIELLLPDPY